MNPIEKHVSRFIFGFIVIAILHGNSVAALSGPEVNVTQRFLLAVGGENGTGENPAAMSSVELYNPETNTWKCVSSLPEARERHGAALLNGLVYVCGGVTYNGEKEEPLTSCITYDVKTDQWNSTGIASMHQTRMDFTLSQMEGKLYAVGGYNEADNTTNTVEQYDPLSNSWTMMKNFPQPCYDHAAVTINNGDNGEDLFIAGGMDLVIGKYAVSYKSLFKYDKVKDSWIALKNMSVQRISFGVVSGHGGKFLYAIDAGNKDVERYDVSHGEWTKSEDVPDPPYYIESPCITSLTDASGKETVYFVGGQIGEPSRDGYRTELREGTKLENIDSRWIKIAPLQYGRTSFTLTTL